MALEYVRLVLATGKNFTHRVYLSRGIWADLTLIFQKGDWLDLPWTDAIARVPNDGRRPLAAGH